MINRVELSAHDVLPGQALQFVVYGDPETDFALRLYSEKFGVIKEGGWILDKSGVMKFDFNAPTVLGIYSIEVTDDAGVLSKSFIVWSELPAQPVKPGIVIAGLAAAAILTGIFLFSGE